MNHKQPIVYTAIQLSLALLVWQVTEKFIPMILFLIFSEYYNLKSGETRK